MRSGQPTKERKKGKNRLSLALRSPGLAERLLSIGLKLESGQRLLAERALEVLDVVLPLAKLHALADQNRLFALAAEEALRVVVVLFAVGGAIADGKERVGQRRLARLAHEAVGVEREVHGVHELAVNDLVAAGTDRRERALEAIAAVRKVVLALKHFRAVAEVVAARVARQVIRMPRHAERAQHDVGDLFAATTARCH